MESDPQKMAALMLGLKGAAVLDTREDESGLWIEIELDAKDVSCPVCGRAATVTGSTNLERRGLPVFGRPSVLSWRLRRWRCSSPACSGGEWLEEAPGVSGG